MYVKEGGGVGGCGGSADLQLDIWNILARNIILFNF